jgi:hypothetical protein
MNKTYLDVVLDELEKCVLSHEADSRLLGNVRADDIAALLVRMRKLEVVAKKAQTCVNGYQDPDPIFFGRSDLKHALEALK